MCKVRQKSFWVNFWRFISPFWTHCPDCKEWMYAGELDMEIDKLVWTCTECLKEWV